MPPAGSLTRVPAAGSQEVTRPPHGGAEEARLRAVRAFSPEVVGIVDPKGRAITPSDTVPNGLAAFALKVQGHDELIQFNNPPRAVIAELQVLTPGKMPDKTVRTPFQTVLHDRKVNDAGYVVYDPDARPLKLTYVIGDGERLSPPIEIALSPVATTSAQPVLDLRPAASSTPELPAIGRAEVLAPRSAEPAIDPERGTQIQDGAAAPRPRRSAPVAIGDANRPGEVVFAIGSRSRFRETFQDAARSGLHFMLTDPSKGEYTLFMGGKKLEGESLRVGPALARSFDAVVPELSKYLDGALARFAGRN